MSQNSKRIEVLVKPIEIFVAIVGGAVTMAFSLSIIGGGVGFAAGCAVLVFRWVTQ